MRILNTGNIGIATVTPTAPLDVAGEIRIGQSGTPLNCDGSRQGALRSNANGFEYCDGTMWRNIIKPAPSMNSGGPTFDFTQTSVQYTNNSCGAFNLYNLKDGQRYQFIVKGTTSATCSFTAYSDAGVSALTVYLPVSHGATTAGLHTLYEIIVAGSDVYLTWQPGMQ